MVAGLFAKRGVTVIDTDEIAHELTRPGAKRSGDTRGVRPKLDRRGRALSIATGCVKPRVRGRRGEEKASKGSCIPDTQGKRRCLRLRATTPYAILVVPLLVEGGFDRSRYSACSVSIARGAAGRARHAAKRPLGEGSAGHPRRAGQREQRLARADDVIDNSGTPGALERQVSHLDEKYLTLAAQSKTAS